MPCTLPSQQSEHPQRLAYVQSKEYQELMANNRIYEQASHDLITNRNRLHKAIQLTFPEIEHLMVNPRGKTTGVLFSDSHTLISY